MVGLSFSYKMPNLSSPWLPTAVIQELPYAVHEQCADTPSGTPSTSAYGKELSKHLCPSHCPSFCAQGQAPEQAAVHP